MALDKTAMATAIRAKVLALKIGDTNDTIGSKLNAAAQAEVLKNWEGICEAIIAYLKTNLDLTLVTHTHSGVTTGPGVSGPPVVVPATPNETAVVS